MVSTRAPEMPYLHEFSTFFCFEALVSVLRGFQGPKITPLDVSVLDGLALESAEMPEPELEELNGGTGTSEPEPAHFGTKSNRTEPWAFCA